MKPIAHFALSGCTQLCGRFWLRSTTLAHPKQEEKRGYKQAYITHTGTLGEAWTHNSQVSGLWPNRALHSPLALLLTFEF